MGERLAPSNLCAVQVASPDRVPTPRRGSAITIGAYDGVHLGHQRVLAALRDVAAARDLDVVVVTFDRHPKAVLRPEDAPLLLTDLDAKLERFAAGGVDLTYVVPFDEERAKETAEAFVDEILVRQLRAEAVLVGEDFRFGHDRRGDVDLLRAAGERAGFTVLGLPLEGANDAPISSTRIRALVAAGDVEGAAVLLGRDFAVCGEVRHGDGRGGPELGFPTANVHLAPGLAQPGDGIYAAWATTEDGARHEAAVSIGRRPTFYDDAPPLIEAHLLNFDRDLYGQQLRLQFVARLRGEARYDTVEALIAQIGRDVDDAHRALARA
jgi:riboflavin kinase/FMN adenylyltransferase